jgi:hypothetical protein
MIMIKFSDANWDSPPGFGYLTVATTTISAILTAIMTHARHKGVPTMSLRRTPVQGRLPSPDAAKICFWQCSFRLAPAGGLITR